MKYIIIAFAFIALVVGVLLYSHNTGGTASTSRITQQTPSATPQEFQFPTSQDTLSVGSTYTIKWTQTDPDTNTQIFLIERALESQGVSVSIADRVYNVPDSGSYEYTVPNISSGEYKFKIGDRTSEYFQVVSAQE